MTNGTYIITSLTQTTPAQTGRKSWAGFVLADGHVIVWGSGWVEIRLYPVAGQWRFLLTPAYGVLPTIVLRPRRHVPLIHFKSTCQPTDLTRVECQGADALKDITPFSFAPASLLCICSYFLTV